MLADLALDVKPYSDYYATTAQRCDGVFKRMDLHDVKRLINRTKGVGSGFGGRWGIGKDEKDEQENGTKGNHTKNKATSGNARTRRIRRDQERSRSHEHHAKTAGP